MTQTNKRRPIMPPKPKFEKEDIVMAAYELAREKGINAVVAREVAKKLGASSSPIFTFYRSMEELKADVRTYAKKMSAEYFNESLNYEPAFKEFGMRWVRFAIDEPKIYELIFVPNPKERISYTNTRMELAELLEPIIDSASKTFNITHDEGLELLNQMFIHANGIAGFCAYSEGEFTEQRISDSISRVCLGLVIKLKLSKGDYDIKMLEAMAKAPSIEPKKIK